MIPDTVQEIDYAALQALIGRVEHAIEHGLALDVEDLRLLLAGIQTLLTLQTQLEEKTVTLNKLRKLLGMIKSSEQRDPEKAEAKDPDHTPKNHPQPGKERKPRKKLEPSVVIHHPITEWHKGDACPACPGGRLIKAEPRVALRIQGTVPYQGQKHIVERLQCNLCGYLISAELPSEFLADGPIDQQYGYSARAMMAILKHFSGIPYYHQETVNDLFGCPISASTVYDQCEQVANAVKPVYQQMRREAGNAVLIYIDDTHNRILEQAPEARPKRNGQGTRIRTGVYTSGLIAILADGQQIYLYQTSLGHAGELLDEILTLREPGLPAPIIMSDASANNLPSVTQQVVLALCNAHARRQFVELVEQYPDDLNPLLDLYGKIWQHDKAMKSLKLSPEQRLLEHQTQSEPVMQQIKTRCEGLLTAPNAEQHSNLAKACRYFVRHYDGLSQFCRTAQAPLDNNVMEEGLKIKIRARKTSHFYKTQIGADVANILTSVIATAYRNEKNPYAYLNVLQRHAQQVKGHAKAWLPWSVQDTT